MIIYASYNNVMAYCKTNNKETGILEARADINQFFADNKDLFVAYNGDIERRLYPNRMILSCYPKQSFITYCAEKGLNCVTNNEWKNRCSYEVLYLMEHYEEVLKPIVDLYTTVWKRYRLESDIFKLDDMGLFMRVLGWR